MLLQLEGVGEAGGLQLESIGTLPMTFCFSLRARARRAASSLPQPA